MIGILVFMPHMMRISSDRSDINVNEKCMYFTDEKPSEPLCWEEQLNSNQARLLGQRKSTMQASNGSYKKVESDPVVFYQKKSVAEMLQRQKMRFHLTSCNLPKLHAQNTENNTRCKPSTKNLSSGKHGSLSKNVNKKSLFSDRLKDQLELKGNAMVNGADTKGFVYSAAKFPEKHCSIKNFNSEMCDNELLLQGKDTRVQSCYTHTTTNVSRESNLPLSDQTSSFVPNQYVDIPVSLPNPALTDESCSIISEARDLNGEIISLEIKTDQKCIKPSSSEEGNTRNEIECSSDNIHRYNELKSTPHEETAPCKHLEKERITRRESKTGSGFNPSKSREDGLSSRLTHTPSTPAPLFLSDEVYELPKGVSPSKGLIELRQTFCKNIRKEAEQLEFDLQELYLKKQLHQR